MTNFIVAKRTYVKSGNTTNKINSSYFYTLIFFIAYLIIYNLIIKEIEMVFAILKASCVSVILGIIIEYIMNLFEKSKNKKITFSNLLNTFSLSLIITLFSYNMNIIMTILALLVSLIIKRKFNNINLSSSLYGILLIIIITYLRKDLVTPLTRLTELNYLGTYDEMVGINGNFLSYLLGSNYLSPLISISIFFYLFYKKSIKYQLFFSYVLTFFTIMLVFGLLKGMNVYYVFFQLTTGNFLFLSVYCLTDFAVTPTIDRGQVIYGIIIGVIACILRFIIPELAIVVSLLIGQVFFTKIIDKISIKLKYNERYLMFISSLCVIFIIITISSLYFII